MAKSQKDTVEKDTVEKDITLAFPYLKGDTCRG
jgi:hypothetical protein